MPHEIKYPRTQAGNQLDDNHGTQVTDPFRWLENDVRNHPAVAQWVEAQNALTQGFPSAIPERGPIAGRFWVDDYGCADNEDEFEALNACSPYHNIRPGTDYPAVLVTTADTGDRVVPGHSFNDAAALQRAQGGAGPVLIRIETLAGHGAGTAVDKKIEESADRWAFLVRVLDTHLPDRFCGNGG